jgi:hypothetical protein
MPALSGVNVEVAVDMDVSFVVVVVVVGPAPGIRSALQQFADGSGGNDDPRTGTQRADLALPDKLIRLTPTDAKHRSEFRNGDGREGKEVGGCGHGAHGRAFPSRWSRRR